MRFIQIFVPCFCCLLLLATPLIGDTKGKLAGIVTNQDTGKPLAKVEITIENSEIKTLTDKTGQFFILNLKPGFYDLKACYLGYVPVIVKNIFVSAGHTSRVNFALSATIIELGKDIEYTRERPLIRQNESFSVQEFPGEDFSGQPIETYGQFLKYLPAFNTDTQNRLHVRGGRSNEILFTVDGLPNNEPFLNRQAYDFLINDIHELLVEDGSFSAEYGSAASGVVQVISKELPQKYAGSFAFQGGNVLTTHSDIFTDEISKFSGPGNWQLQANFGGPFPKYLSDRLFFRISTRFWDDAGYLYGEDKFTPTGDVKSESPGFVALNPWQRFSLGIDFNYHLKPNLNLEYRSNYQYQCWQDYQTVSDLRWRFLPDSRIWQYQRAGSQFLKLSHQPSKKLYYTFMTGYLWHRHQAHAFDSVNDEQYQWSGLPDRDNAGEFFISGSNNYRMNANTNSWITKFDLTTQLGHRHLLQTGFDFKRRDVTFHQYYLEVDRDGRDNNRDGIPGNVGVNPDSLDDAFRHQPMEMALYLQDKIEWHSVVLNLGGRLETFFPDAETKTGWWQSSTDSSAAAANKLKFSPRIAVSYNISENGKLFSAYGHYYQVPPYWGLYSNPEQQIYSSRYLSQIGNADMELQQTVSYEIGLEHKIGTDIVARLKWFYRDFRNMPGRRIYLIPNGLAYHAVWDAADFGFAQGAIFRLTKSFSKTLRVDLDYTWQHVKTNNPEPYPEQKISQTDFQQRSYAALYPADWNQPHSFQAHLSWMKPNVWGVRLHGKVASGYAFTEKSIDPLRDTATYNSSRGPLQINLDLSAFKSFPIWIGYKETALCIELKAYNLLDRLNEKVVWPTSGNADKPIELLQVNHSEEWMTRPFWYSKPREIFLGLRYSF